MSERGEVRDGALKEGIERRERKIERLRERERERDTERQRRGGVEHWIPGL